MKFDVSADGSSLRKPVVLRPGPDGKSLFRAFQLRGQHISASGYLYAASGKLAPRDLNGVLVRIRNAAVGKYDSSFLGSPSWINPLFRTWTTCELYADDALESAMNIDRRSFRTTDPAYAELRTLFHAELRDFLTDVREELYRQRSLQRNRQRAEEQARRLEELRDRLSPDIGTEGANDVVDNLKSSRTRAKPEKPSPSSRAGATDAPPEPETEAPPEQPTPPAEPIDVRALNKTFTPVQVMEVVAAAAIEIGLEPTEVRELLSEISRRLHG